MNIISDEQRRQKAKTLPITFDHLYSSPESGFAISRVYKKYHLPPERYLNYSRTIGDLILGFKTTSELPELLETELEIDEATAIARVEDLRNFLKPVYDRENGLLPPEPEPEPSYEEKVQAASEPATTLTKATPTWNATLLEKSSPAESTTPEPNEKISTMRTMAGDMKKIHGYGAYRDENPTDTDSKEHVTKSSQDEALQPERPRLADTPRVSEEATPSA